MAVARYGEPAALFAWEGPLVDHSTLVAWWLTWACYVYVLVPLAIALLLVAWRVPAWRARIVLSVVMALLCWRGADLFQHVFARPRRLDWVVKHETAFSYPSSHAAIATGFYALWAVMLGVSDLPRAVRVAGAVLLGHPGDRDLLVAARARRALPHRPGRRRAPGRGAGLGRLGPRPGKVFGARAGRL